MLPDGSIALVKLVRELPNAQNGRIKGAPTVPDVETKLFNGRANDPG